MKAVLHYRASDGFRAALAHSAVLARVDAVVVDETDEPGFVREIADADVLLHVLKPVTAAMVAAGPRLKLVQKLGVGVNTIDLEACKAGGVAVANMPGTNSQAVAEMTARGATVLGEPRIGAHGTPIVFLHPRDTGGVLIELMESPAGDH